MIRMKVEIVAPEIDVTQSERRHLTLFEFLELQKHSVHSDCTVVLLSQSYQVTQGINTD